MEYTMYERRGRKGKKIWFVNTLIHNDDNFRQMMREPHVNDDDASSLFSEIFAHHRLLLNYIVIEQTNKQFIYFFLDLKINKLYSP